ncbi:uncharacterized protein HI_0077-like isoform X2 [Watersipora subatra]|uniref:uncharacterized protein HI_0077-like isoform X2 n=1 Tax=Watersipora subatra TaxID=2589382 RepID=UPI00355BF98A
MSGDVPVNQRLLECLKNTVEVEAWHSLGNAEGLKSKAVRRLYGEHAGEDLVLIYDDQHDRFHALDAMCSHEGGPLDLGDIEEVDGRRCIVCPWHHYEFRLADGYSDSSGLQQDVYPTMVVDGDLFVRTGEMELTLEPRLPAVNNGGSFGETEMGQTASAVESTGTLSHAAFNILTAADPVEKIRLSQLLGADWKAGIVTKIGSYPPPQQPVRAADQLKVVAPGKEAKRGKGGTLASRISILHSLANIELWAIDLTWDILARFLPHFRLAGESLPKAFTDDFVQVAVDETKHFKLLSDRLNQLGSHFGALPVHNGLWESAEATNESLLARLAVVHMVHEARGLDVQPTQIHKFERQKDAVSLSILEIIYTEEITHVAAGLRWFNYICERTTPQLDPVMTFHDIVRKYFKGYLKPPFNSDARKKAGMTAEWYEPLTKAASAGVKETATPGMTKAASIGNKMTACSGMSKAESIGITHKLSQGSEDDI